MCEYSGSDGDRPSAYRQLEQTARVEHECDECRGKILPGEKYQFISGVWDGEPSSYHTCMPCVVVRREFTRAHHGERPYLCGLDEALEECVREETRIDDDDNEILSESGKRWRKARDEMRARREAAKAVANG